MRYEEKIRKGRNDSWVRKCLIEIEERGWRDRYGKGRESYYKRNGWGICALSAIRNNEVRDFEAELISRERDIQRQWEERKIVEAKYNVKYKQIGVKEGGPNYLRKECLVKERRGDDVRAPVRLRCGNMEEANKYWKDESEWKCLFCGIGEDKVKHFVEECEKVKGWFWKLEINSEERWSRLWSEELDERKGKILRKLWREKEKRLREIRKDKEKGGRS